MLGWVYIYIRYIRAIHNLVECTWKNEYFLYINSKKKPMKRLIVSGNRIEVMLV